MRKSKPAGKVGLPDSFPPSAARIPVCFEPDTFRKAARILYLDPVLIGQPFPESLLRTIEDSDAKPDKFRVLFS